MAFTFDEFHGNPGRKKNFLRAAAKFHLRDGILHRQVKHGIQALPALTPTTGNSFSPTTPITYSGSNSPDEDITVVGESGPPEALFNPTDLTWRKLQCSRLVLPAPEMIPDRQSRDYLGLPEATDSILDDGNCFFRAVSFEITGSQEHHEEVRAFTVSFLRENHETFSNYIGMDIETHFNKSGMESVRTWATVEIICLATLLQTVIYVYTVTGGSRNWIPYKPYFTSSSPDGNYMRQAIYLSNMSAHFERVLRVKLRHCQNSGLGSK
ncbi:otu domain-containing protein 5 [Plakobranchus ocellatus]|uniref:Otu domain-containing protein 5 n=1 Tax=Plakobranchus ocellatus TaxID=259542 RepID=A0AAV4CAD8_9GAST|nr:otu domain-containing protein 5 [Plakobranchus ocellatus]